MDEHANDIPKFSAPFAESALQTSTALQTSAAALLSSIGRRLDKTNELLELILTALDEKKTAAPSLQTKYANVQKIIFEHMQQHGGGTAAEIAKRMAMPDNSIGPGLYRLWHKGKVSIERMPGPSGPVNHYKIK